MGFKHVPWEQLMHWGRGGICLYVKERKKKALIQTARGNLLKNTRLLIVFQSPIAPYTDFTSKIAVPCFPHLNNGN